MKKQRLADYVCDVLASHGIRNVFLVTGGGAMHLNDAFGRHEKIKYVACHHEQACSMAADSYFRMTGELAAVNVTTGPGGTNALTGVFGAWTDSLGMVVVSGQVKFETTIHSTDLPLRQLGDQEVDIVAIAKPITKYAVMVKNPNEIRYHIEKAIYLAKSGRPGPVWIDIPINVQSAIIDVDSLEGFDPKEDKTQTNFLAFKKAAAFVREKIKNSKRPIVICGGGVRISQSHIELLEFLENYQIPVATAWNAHDLIWDDHPLYVGRPGTIGDRAGNFAVQNSDLVIILGCRLNIRQVSYNWKSFAREAFKIMVDIDMAEIQKPTLSIDYPIHGDLKVFLKEMVQLGKMESCNDHTDWIEWCKLRQKSFPVVPREYWENKEKVNPYCFVQTLFNELKEGDLTVTGDGTACVSTFQAAVIKKGQRLFTNSGCASMGYDLPAAIGAYFAVRPNRIICIAGDGSLQMNLQELQTIVTYKIPVKIFILNNQGYHSIRQTQQSFFKGSVVGCGVESGLGFPDMEKIAYAYNIPFRRCENHSELQLKIKECLEGNGPQICELMLDLNQQFSPKLSSRKLEDGSMVTSPLEDMAPFLDRDEFLKNMIIKPVSQ